MQQQHSARKWRHELSLHVSLKSVKIMYNIYLAKFYDDLVAQDGDHATRKRNDAYKKFSSLEDSRK